MHNLYLSLGSNLGDRMAFIQQALELLDKRIGRIVRISTILESEPWGFTSEHKFLNACCLVHTLKSPRRCLKETQIIERKLGRKQKSQNGQYHDRPIDIDLLMYDNLEINEPDLILPHPRMKEREFVMTPLKEILDK